MVFQYECPRCGSKKTPRIVQYFPPKQVQCPECYETRAETEFIKDTPSATDYADSLTYYP